MPASRRSWDRACAHRGCSRSTAASDRRRTGNPGRVRSVPCTVRRPRGGPRCVRPPANSRPAATRSSGGRTPSPPPAPGAIPSDAARSPRPPASGRSPFPTAVLPSGRRFRRFPSRRAGAGARSRPTARSGGFLPRDLRIAGPGPRPRRQGIPPAPARRPAPPIRSGTRPARAGCRATARAGRGHPVQPRLPAAPRSGPSPAPARSGSPPPTTASSDRPPSPRNQRWW